MIFKSNKLLPAANATRVTVLSICIILLVNSSLLFYSCQKFEHTTGIETVGVKDIGIHQARFYMQLGDVSSNPSIQFGFCWANHTLPTNEDSVYIKGENPEIGITYDHQTVTLAQNSVYYMRAFTLENGTPFYSDEVRFETNQGTPPTVSAIVISQVTSNSADCTGEISGIEDDPIVESGICYNTAGNPVLNDSILVDITHSTNLHVPIMNLKPNQTYYARAFATNSAGTGLGPVQQFKTPAALPTVETFIARQTTASTTLLSGKILNNGGAQIIDSGFVWGIYAQPDLTHNKVGPNFQEAFSAFVSQLPANTTIHYRAFAKNIQGIGYGQEYELKTIPLTNAVSDAEGNTYNTAQFGNQIWMTQNLKSLKYSDGSDIPEVVAYNNEEANVSKTGRLYTWKSAAKNSFDPGVQGACPDGWHLPTTAEWDTLVNYFGGAEIAGLFMKDVYNGLWQGLSTNTNYATEVNIPAGGFKYETFNNYYYTACYWSSSISYKDNNIANQYRLNSNPNQQVTSGMMPIVVYGSLRCVKNE